jgi:hypothetical protein
MIRVLLDEVLRNKLLDLRQPLELCDESGKVLAQVTPVGQTAANAATEPQLSEEEL